MPELIDETYQAYTIPDYVSDLTGETVTQAHCLAATALIKNYTGIRYDKLHTVTNKVYSGNGDYWLDLGVYPLKSVTSVLLDDSAITDYKTPSQHGNADGYLYREYTWPVGIANLKISFTYGHDVVPQLVKDIASRVAALLKNENFHDIKSEKLDYYSVTYVQDKDTNDKIDKLLEKLPKDSNITAVGEDSTHDILASTENLIPTGYR